MNEHLTSGPRLSLADVYHTLFRQKWKILVVLALSVAVSVALYFTMPPTYTSEAKLLIKSVVDTKTPTPPSGNTFELRSPDRAGDTIINSEIEILTSHDLAQQVAVAVGPEKILGGKGAQANPVTAGTRILRGLQIDVPRRTCIIRMVFEHPDPETAQKVLHQLIQVYQKRHVDIHLQGGLLDDTYQKAKDNLGNRLKETEEELRKLKTKAGVISLEDAKKSYVEELSKIRQELFAAEAQLEERKAALLDVQKNLSATNHPGTNRPPEAVGPELVEKASAEKIAAYQKVCARLVNLEARELDYEAAGFTEEHPLVKTLRSQLAELKKKKEDLEKETPGLAQLSIPAQAPGRPQDFNPETDSSRTAALEFRVKSLNARLEKIKAEAMGLDEAETTYAQLQRQKQLEEADFQYYAGNLARSRIDDALGPGRISNINVVEAATAPMRAPGFRRKAILGVLAGGLFAGFLLAFLVEHFFDQSIKRPVEVEKKLRLPLLLWIPQRARNGTSSPPSRPPPKPLALERSGAGSAALVPAGSASLEDEIAPWDPEHQLRDYYEALRDRLVTYFEIRNMTHKPKLVAVTGCSKGSGVTTIATGLAAVLSETGDGNVLLVDMNGHHGTTHQFHKGSPHRSLAEALDGERADAQLQDKLYLASASPADEKLPRILPQAFTHLVPRMKASDYDYIIFDMPPVSQTSATSRLARHMDMTVLVIEAEKDHLDAVKRATASLVEAKANVSALLNKKRTYVPERLLPEI